ncbi:MAG TPA: metalloregulator ArsR/SmtB family transcription factor [Acidimicrobiales bacterium]|jgi:ArsR family transcriptional regulator|nr:metalloregulator ArsR/SmtB family transcription factor [Acidimicrobiales bacterium]
MPLIYDDPPPAGPQVTIGGSAAVELEWALTAAGRPDYQRDHAALAAVYTAMPRLRERVRSFWDGDGTSSCGCFLELLVLAHHGSLLLSTDAGVLIDRLDDLCTTAPHDLTLASETSEDRATVLARLDHLRSSPTLRRRYVKLIGDVWEAVRSTWEQDGRPAVESAVAARRRLLTKGAPWPEVASGGYSVNGLMEQLVEAMRPDDHLVVVPAYFNHKGLLVELPGVVVVGVSSQPSAIDARARTEALARRIKILGDPTRLAILDTLTTTPRTVTELAATFQLAQPTVSNHVKMLRDAGLVGAAPGRPRRELAVQHDVADELVQQLQAVLAAPSVP